MTPHIRPFSQRSGEKGAIPPLPSKTEEGEREGKR
jgi:hypothetical protein